MSVFAESSRKHVIDYLQQTDSEFIELFIYKRYPHKISPLQKIRNYLEHIQNCGGDFHIS